MKKVFRQIKRIFPDILITILFVAIICLLWIFVGEGNITNCLTGILAALITCSIPVHLGCVLYYFYVAVDSSSISCEVINDKTDNGGWVEDLENVKSVKITTKEECQKYYKNCNSKKVILIDFGNGNVKYIPLTYFTKRQSRRIVKTIEENVERIKQAKHSA